MQVWTNHVFQQYNYLTAYDIYFSTIYCPETKCVFSVVFQGLQKLVLLALIAVPL